MPVMFVLTFFTIAWSAGCNSQKDDVSHNADGSFKRVESAVDDVNVKPFLGEQHTVRFDRRFDDVVIGGKGRYFILHFPAQSDTSKHAGHPDSSSMDLSEKLVIWDLLTLETSFQVSVTPAKNPIKAAPKSSKVKQKQADNTQARGKTQSKVFVQQVSPQMLFAAGIDELIVYQRGTNQFERWSLTSKNRIGVLDNHLPGDIHDLSMGAGSRSPLLLVVSKGSKKLDPCIVYFADPTTLGVLYSSSGYQLGHRRRDRLAIHAASNGTTFTFANTSISSSGLKYITLSDKAIIAPWRSDEYGHLLPSPDGKNIFSAGGIMESAGMTTVMLNTADFGQVVFPATNGPYYLELVPTSEDTNQSPRPAVLNLRVLGHKTRFAQLDHVQLDFGFVDRRALSQLSIVNKRHDKNLFLVPWANALVVIPKSANRLDIYRTSMDKILNKSGADYLFVTSQPPVQIMKGSHFQYQIVVESSSPSPQLKLALGPQGSSLSTQGLIQWTVTDNHPMVSFIIRIEGSGKVTYHNFILQVEQ